MLYPSIVAVIIALDQITKYIVRKSLVLGETVPVIGDWFRFTYLRNEGAAFSMFSGNHMVTIVLTSVLLVACLIFVYKEAKHGSKVFAICLTCVLGGGLSNMIDRVYAGFVTDMISVGSFAIFNVADMFVTCGCIVAIIYVLFFYQSGGKRRRRR